MNNTKIAEVLSSYIAPGKLVVFAIANCPYCTWAKKLLTELKADFTYLNVYADIPKFNDDFERSLEKYCDIDTYPKILIGTKCIGGFTDMETLHKNKTLQGMLKKEGINFDGYDKY